jgi:hypothetical protein
MWLLRFDHVIIEKALTGSDNSISSHRVAMAYLNPRSVRLNGDIAYLPLVDFKRLSAIKVYLQIL